MSLTSVFIMHRKRKPSKRTDRQTRERDRQMEQKEKQLNIVSGRQRDISDGINVGCQVAVRRILSFRASSGLELRVVCLWMEGCWFKSPRQAGRENLGKEMTL